MKTVIDIGEASHEALQPDSSRDRNQAQTALSAVGRLGHEMQTRSNDSHPNESSS